MPMRGGLPAPFRRPPVAQQARPPGPGRGGFGPAGPGVRRVMPNKKPVNKRDLPGWVRSSHGCVADHMHAPVDNQCGLTCLDNRSEVCTRE